MPIKRHMFFASLCGAAAVLSTAASAQLSKNGLLSSLNEGLWELKAVGGGPSRAAQSRICIGDLKNFIQIQHGNAQCAHRVLASKGNRVTVSYNCSGQGQGVTTIRRETNGLIQINSQGIRNGSPFHFEVEGRYRGSCR